MQTPGKCSGDCGMAWLGEETPAIDAATTRDSGRVSGAETLRRP